MTHPVTLTSPVLALSLARVQRLVGGKTTLRLTNSQNFGFREGPDETLLSHLRSAASLTAYKRMRQGDPSVQMMAFHPSFVEHMSRIFDKHIPTSGLYGIILSLQMCKRVSLFGFHVSASHGVKYHYYDVCDRPANVRRDSIEWYAVKALSQGRVVRFKEDCVMECNVNRYQCRTCKKERKFKDVEDYGPAERRGGAWVPQVQRPGGWVQARSGREAQDALGLQLQLEDSGSGLWQRRRSEEEQGAQGGRTRAQIFEPWWRGGPRQAGQAHRGLPRPSPLALSSLSASAAAVPASARAVSSPPDLPRRSSNRSKVRCGRQRRHLDWRCRGGGLNEGKGGGLLCKIRCCT